MKSTKKKTVRFNPESKIVMYDPKKPGIQRFKTIGNTKTVSANNASIYGPWKKPKGPHYAPHSIERPFFKKFTIDNRGNIVRTWDPTGHRLENILYYQNQISKLMGRK